MEFDCIPILSVGIEDVIIPGAQASGDLRWMHATRYQRILRSIVRHLPGNAAEALRRNEPGFRSADGSFFRSFSGKVSHRTQALKGRTNDECRQPTRLTDHFALIADAALAFVCESLHACENRIGVEMRFRDHVRFEAAASPAIIEVGRE